VALITSGSDVSYAAKTTRLGCADVGHGEWIEDVVEIVSGCR
jgi:hypothetical protein